MPIKIYIYTNDPIIKGSTKDKNMATKNASELHTFEFGTHTDINISTSSRGSGKAEFKELIFSKSIDSASCGWLEKLCTGNHIDDVVIEFQKQGIKESHIIFKLELKHVMVQDISTQIADNDPDLLETIVVQCGAIRQSYSQQDAKTGKVSAHSDWSWSRIKNNGSFGV